VKDEAYSSFLETKFFCTGVDMFLYGGEDLRLRKMPCLIGLWMVVSEQLN